MKRSQVPRSHWARCVIGLLAQLSLAATGASAAAADGSQVHAFQWQKASPASQRMDGTRLEALKDSLAGRQTKAFLVIRNDRIVYEWYSKDHGPDKPHYTASMAKALVGGVAVAVTISDGCIELDDLAAKYVPQWKEDSRKAKITIRHLGSHTSGLEDSSVEGFTHTEEPGWKGEFWKRLDPPQDPFSISRDAAPVLFEPGTQMQYSNPGIAMLSYCVTVALRDAPHTDIRTLLRERIMRPIGVADREWSIGYGRTYMMEGLPLVAPWGGGGYTARATARVGRLMLREGDWDGRRLVSAEAVRQVTRDAGTPGNCGIGWWNNNDGAFPELPKDAFWGSGAGHQVVCVVPSLNLIAVRNGGTLGTETGHHEALQVHLFRPLVEAVVDAPSTAKVFGLLRVHPTNPRYFTDGAKNPDGSLKAIYLTGSHHWDNLQDGYNPEVSPFDCDRYLDLLQKHHHNFIRLWAWEHLAAKRSWHYDHREQRFGPMPHERTGPGTARDGQPKLDLRQFHQPYFDRLRQRVEAAGQRGIYVGIMLFQGVASTGPATWPGHIFNKENNINGIDGSGTGTQTLKSPAITELQKAYIRKVIDTVNDLDNVLYEIANEAHPTTADWQYEMVRYIKSYEAAKPKQHAVGMTCRGDEPDNEVLWRSPADWISPGTYKIYAHDPPAADGRKVSLLDTDHVFGVGGDRRWVWKAFVRGHNPIYMDPLWGYIPAKEPWIGQAERGVGARKAMGDTRDFAERMNLAAMTPQAALSSTRYCLADPGNEYLVYQPKQGEFTVRLPEGEYAVEWFDPESRDTTRAGSVVGGDEPRFAPPFSGDAVLYLRRITE